MIRAATAAFFFILIGSAADCRAQSHTLFAFDGGAKHDLLGISIDGVGDVDGDGRPDLVIGAYEANQGRGEARVYSGATGVVVYTFSGDSAGDRFGRSVAGAGDVDNDGVPDMIVGAYHDDDKGIDSGSARVFSGKDGKVLYTFFGDSANDEFGTAVRAAGDVNADGFADVIVGSPCDDPNGTDSGSAKVFSGKDGSVLHTFRGDSAHDWFGYAVHGAGDVDLDGHDDVIVGACYDDVGAFNNGSARVYSGRTGAVLFTLVGISDSDWFGVSVAGVGDLDGDGRPDLAVGAATSDLGGPNSGAVHVFSGADGSPLYTLIGQQAGDEFGVSVCGCGDFDGDKVPDIVVGAYRGSSANPGGGSVYVYSGRDGEKMMTCEGEATDDRLGVAVAGVGDVNGDSLADIAAGAVYSDRNDQDSGTAYIFTGAALTLVASPPTLSAKDGGTQTIEIDAGKKHAGRTYVLVGSMSGTSPGTTIGGVQVPLNSDSYMTWTLQNANSTVLSGFRGTLDQDGKATAAFNLPPNMPQSLVGITFHHAFLVYKKKSVKMVSNPMPLTFTQ